MQRTPLGRLARTHLRDGHAMPCFGQAFAAMPRCTELARKGCTFAHTSRRRRAVRRPLTLYTTHTNHTIHTANANPSFAR